MRDKKLRNKKPGLNPLNVSLSYASIAIIWIWATGAIVDRLSLSGHVAALVETVKGTFFVLVTTLLLYLLIRRMVTQILEIQAAHEKELRESEDRFRAFMDHSPTIAWAKDDQGRYVYLNRTYQKRFGVSQESGLGKSDFDIWPTETARRFRDTDLIVSSSGEPVEIKEMATNADGTTSMWQSSKFRFTDSGGRSYIGGLGIDITKKEETEASLREKEGQLRLFFQHAPIALAMFDNEMRYLLASDRWLSDYGLKGKDIYGRSHYDVIPGIPDRWKEIHRRVLAGETLRQDEDKFDRIDGSIQYLQWVALPWTRQKGEIGGIIIVTEDITDRKRAEAEMLELQGQFHQAQKLEAIGRLTGGIAHDFNNLLMIILAQTELLQLDPNDDQVPKRIVTIADTARRAADLTRQLLAYSRKQVLQPSPQNIGELVSSLENMLARSLGENIRIDVRTPSEVWLVMVDRSQIEQVVLNLAVNARDAMPKGGSLSIEVSNVDTRQQPCPLDASISPGRYVRLSVKDTGTGIAPEIQDKIFEPFFSTKPPGKGTGLGLSTVYGIVKQSGGCISLESELGRGTCFSLYFPVTGATSIPAHNNSAAKPAMQEHLSILLVEDQPELCFVIGEYLKSAGHSVWEAHNRNEALEIVAARKNQIDVIVSDIVLPESNGRDLINEINALGCSAKTLFISGYSDEIIDEHQVSGPDALFLQKPFGKAALLEKVRQARSLN